MSLDPSHRLPPELVALIFDDLDPQSLFNASQVSSSWRRHSDRPILLGLVPRLKQLLYDAGHGVSSDIVSWTDITEIERLLPCLRRMTMTSYFDRVHDFRDLYLRQLLLESGWATPEPCTGHIDLAPLDVTDEERPPLTAVIADIKGKGFVTADADGCIATWRVDPLERRHIYYSPHRYPIRYTEGYPRYDDTRTPAVVMALEGDRLAAGYNNPHGDAEIVVWERRSDALVRDNASFEVAAILAVSGSVHSLILRDDVCIAVLHNATVKAWKMETPSRCSCPVAHHSDMICTTLLGSVMLTHTVDGAQPLVDMGVVVHYRRPYLIFWYGNTFTMFGPAETKVEEWRDLWEYPETDLRLHWGARDMDGEWRPPLETKSNADVSLPMRRSKSDDDRKTREMVIQTANFEAALARPNPPAGWCSVTTRPGSTIVEISPEEFAQDPRNSILQLGGADNESRIISFRKNGVPVLAALPYPKATAVAFDPCLLVSVFAVSRVVVHDFRPRPRRR